MARAYATLLTKEAYLAGVLVLEQGLRAVGSKYPLVVMVTPALPAAARRVLTKRRIPTRDIEGLYPAVARHTLADARFEDTWTKLRWVIGRHCTQGGTLTNAGSSS